MSVSFQGVRPSRLRRAEASAGSISQGTSAGRSSFEEYQRAQLPVETLGRRVGGFRVSCPRWLLETVEIQGLAGPKNRCSIWLGQREGSAVVALEGMILLVGIRFEGNLSLTFWHRRLEQMEGPAQVVPFPWLAFRLTG